MTTSPAKPAADAVYAPCVSIAGAMIGHFTTRLEVEAGKAGGTLDAAAIRAIAERFLAEEHGRFAATFQRSWDGCSTVRDQRQWDAERRRPFDRILTRKFSHLFPPRSGGGGGGGRAAARDAVLSRRMLPGFHLAVDKVIGPALYQQCQRKSLAILDKYRRANGGIDWDSVHGDADAQALAGDVLMVVAHSFTEFEHRRGWFIDLVNGNLAAPAASTADALWRLTTHGFAELMRALFADLGAALAATPDSLRRRYGDNTVTMLAAFLRRLEWE
jgi:hypothetical protein